MVKHAYAVGRLRALEARMLDLSQITRMVDAQDLQSAFMVLSETAYSEKIDKLSRPFDFEELIRLELASVKALLDDLAPNDPILDVLFKKYDYHNLKVLLKNKFMGISPKEALYGIGTLPLHELEGLEIARQAEEVFSQEQSLMAIEDLIDKEYLRILKLEAQKSGVPLFLDYATVFSISSEIKIALRSKEKDPAEMIKAYKYTDFAPALDSFDGPPSLFKLERALDDLLLLKIRKARYFTFGIEPLIGFLHAKEVELKIIRLVLVSKLNKVQQELIKERLRLSYV